MIRSPIVKECKGCCHIDNGFCSVYPNPAYWWTNKMCPIRPKTIEEQPRGKKRVGQQKHAKKKGKR